MNETAPTNETSQDAAEAAKNISTLSDYEKVREALVTSVMCSPIRFHSSQESIVPNNASPA